MIEGRIFFTQGVTVVVVEEFPEGHGFDLEGVRPRVETLFRAQGVTPDWNDVDMAVLSPVWRKGDRYTPIKDTVIRKDGEPHLHVSVAFPTGGA